MKLFNSCLMEYPSWESNVTNITNVTPINQILVSTSKLKLSPHVSSTGSRKTGRTVSLIAYPVFSITSLPSEIRP